MQETATKSNSAGDGPAGAAASPPTRGMTGEAARESKPGRAEDTAADFRRMADIALNASKADHTFVSFDDTHSGTTRFANSQVTQNVDTRRQTLSVSAAFGRQHGSASTTDLSDTAIRDAVGRAEEIARVCPADPEYMPPLPPQKYLILPTARPETAAAGPARRLEEARRAIELCRAAQFSAAGIVSTTLAHFGVAASSGLFAFEPRTSAEFSLTATGPDSSGWVNNANRSIDDLGVDERTKVAIEKARLSARPREIPAGRYTVVLEPAAVAGFGGALLFALDAKSYYRKTSALAGRLNERIIDERLTLENRPDHPSLLGDSFDGAGLPANSKAWIDRGVLKELDYDRFTAQEHGVPPSYGLDAAHLSGASASESPAAESVESLIAGVERGVLVTNFWYIRDVNETDLTITGMTRDGTFLIENGRLAGGLINFRFHDSPLRGLNAVRAFSRPLDAITMERSKMMLPALVIGEFNFSSVTRF